MIDGHLRVMLFAPSGGLSSLSRGVMKAAEPKPGPCQNAMLRRLLSVILVVILIPIVIGRSARFVSVQAAATDNPIVVENQQPGSNGWFWTNVGDDIAG